MHLIYFIIAAIWAGTRARRSALAHANVRRREKQTKERKKKEIFY
jgi:hypothetical protein